MIPVVFLRPLKCVLIYRGALNPRGSFCVYIVINKHTKQASGGGTHTNFALMITDVLHGYSSLHNTYSL